MAIRILLVDDSDDFRAVVRELLQQQSDLEVVGEAGDGNAAIQQAQALKPDVISMDVKMPNVDGVEATKQIVAIVPSAKVLGLSLHTKVSVVQSMIDAGVSGFVSKNDAYEELIPAIRVVAEGENYFSESLPPPFGTGEDDDDDPDTDDQ